VTDRVEQFYGFMQERESIRLARLRGDKWPWTSDLVLRAYKFTNVKRAHDKTSQLLRTEFYETHVTKHPEAWCGQHEGLALTNLGGHRVILLNCALFRLFGSIEMVRAVGWKRHWDQIVRASVEAVAKSRLEVRATVYTKAYIIPNCGESRPKHEIVCDIVTGIWQDTGDILGEMVSWQAACERMQRVRGVGPFLAKEIVLDYVMATGWCPQDWQLWTPVGLGAVRGAARLTNDGQLRPMTERRALEVCRDLYGRRELHWPKRLVELDLTDVQFQLCEYDKWLRCKFGEGVPKNRFLAR
jgi:hypothetical protein